MASIHATLSFDVPATPAGTESVSLPEGMAENDIVLLGGCSDQAITIGITSADWNSIQLNRSTNSPGFFLAWKRMGTVPDTAVQFDRSGVGDGMAVCGYVLRGINPLVVLDVTPPLLSAGSSGMPDPPSSGTLNTAGCCIVAVGFLDDDNVTATAPVGFTHDISRNGALAGTNATAMMGAISSHGSTVEVDPGPFGGVGSDAWLGFTLAFRPDANVSVSPAVGAIAVIGHEPNPEVHLNVLTGSIAVIGYAPTVRRIRPPSWRIFRV